MDGRAGRFNPQWYQAETWLVRWDSRCPIACQTAECDPGRKISSGQSELVGGAIGISIAAPAMDDPSGIGMSVRCPILNPYRS
jgi:hypothetical protein